MIKNHSQRSSRRPVRPLLLGLFAAGAFLTVAQRAHAQQTLYWDADGNTSTATGGTGPWDTTSSLWRLGSSTGTLQTYPADTATQSTTTADFAGTAGTVTLSTALGVNAITFGTASYLLTGSAANTLTLLGTTPTITGAGSGSTGDTISAVLAGTAGVTIAGTASVPVIFTGANTYSGGTTISSGLLQIGSTSVAPVAGTLGSGNVVLNATGGGTGLQFSGADSLTISNTISGAALSRLTQAGTGTLVLTGANTYGSGGFTLLNSGTLQGADTTATHSGNATLTTVFGASTLSAANGTTIQLRANGDGTATAQTLTFGNAVQIASTGATVTVDVDQQATTGGTNKTIGLGSFSVGANVKLNVTGADAYNLAASITPGGGTTTSIVTLNPTTANLIVGTIGAGTNTANPVVALDGTSSGNQVTGIISNNTGTTTGITKSNSSTWTLSGASTYTGATTVSGGTLKIDSAGSTTARLSGATPISITGGILQLVNSTATASTDRLNNASTISLGGGTFNLGGLSEGAAGTTGVGALTLTATSTLDFGTTGTSNVIQFAGLGTHAAGTLTITDYDNSTVTDHLYFAGTSSTFAGLYAQNTVSFNGTAGYTATDFGAYYEISPAAVPEPSTWVGALLLSVAGAGAVRRRYRRQQA